MNLRVRLEHNKRMWVEMLIERSGLPKHFWAMWKALGHICTRQALLFRILRNSSGRSILLVFQMRHCLSAQTYGKFSNFSTFEVESKFSNQSSHNLEFYGFEFDIAEAHQLLEWYF